MEVSRFEDQFEYEIILDPALEIEHLEVPPLIIQPYVENAIWHGLMIKEDKLEERSPYFYIIEFNLKNGQQIELFQKCRL